ncbi:MAG TPA: hypothetical protein VHU81_13285 [Thermoanaerobaculia bacterium]|jgi:hypothetical protein|nr:hypothetical protein [Thermoanaerobaculia bacterium]
MELSTILQYVGIAIVVILALAGLTLTWAFQRLRRIRVPANADFFTTIRAVPLALVAGLDLLDLALDSFSTPIIWVILNRLNLSALRNVASFEALIPFTGPIPTLTLAWFAARALNLGETPDPSVIETERVGPHQYAPRMNR